ncbi:sulfite exporter TauE/SafE family protein [Bacillus timonensis]|nr:sulfite exporter TauE/SafE family protein [Bacillus timonensis]
MDLFYFLLLGLGIGILSGFFGIGGGFVLTPILLLIGYSPIYAIPTSLLYTVATSFSGSIAHFRMKNIEWKTAILIGIMGIMATQIAQPFVFYLEEMNLADTLIPLFYLVLISYFSIIMFKKNSSTNKPGTLNKKVPSIIVCTLIGLFAGAVSTILGVGGGFIIVPLLIRFLRFPSKKAVGTSLVSVLLIVTFGYISYSNVIKIDYVNSSFLIIGALIGSQLGAAFVRLYTDRQIQTYLGGLYLFVGTSLILSFFHLDMIGLFALCSYSVLLILYFTNTMVRVKWKSRSIE